jgi:hypothetical protein
VITKKLQSSSLLSLVVEIFNAKFRKDGIEEIFEVRSSPSGHRIPSGSGRETGTTTVRILTFCDICVIKKKTKTTILHQSNLKMRSIEMFHLRIVS